MTRGTVEIMVCTDCALYLTYGETEGAEPSWNPGHIEQRWSSYYLCNGDSDKANEFSWSPCETCGSRLGGARYHCVAISD